MPQQDDTALELACLKWQVSDLQAALVERDVEILRLKTRVNDLIDKAKRLSQVTHEMQLRLDVANSIIQDVY